MGPVCSCEAVEDDVPPIIIHATPKSTTRRLNPLQSDQSTLRSATLDTNHSADTVDSPQGVEDVGSPTWQSVDLYSVDSPPLVSPGSGSAASHGPVEIVPTEPPAEVLVTPGEEDTPVMRELKQRFSVQHITPLLPYRSPGSKENSHPDAFLCADEDWNQLQNMQDVPDATEKLLHFLDVFQKEAPGEYNSVLKEWSELITPSSPGDLMSPVVEAEPKAPLTLEKDVSSAKEVDERTIKNDISNMVKFIAWMKNNIRASACVDYNDAEFAMTSKDVLKRILRKMKEREDALSQEARLLHIEDADSPT